MKTVRLEFPVTMLCKTLCVSRNGFYDWLHAEPSARAQEDARLKVLITAAHRQGRETYGTRRVKHELAAEGHDVGRDRDGRLRRELALRCKQRRQPIAGVLWQDDTPSIKSRWQPPSQQRTMDYCDGTNAKRATYTRLCREKIDGRIVEQGNPSLR
jgi:hypothetical protein